MHPPRIMRGVFYRGLQENRPGTVRVRCDVDYWILMSIFVLPTFRDVMGHKQLQMSGPTFVPMVRSSCAASVLFFSNPPSIPSVAIGRCS